MKTFVILSVLVAGAIAARLDNTYIPPASAQSAGGYNLDTPKVAQASIAQNTYAAPAGGQNQFQQQSHSQGGLNHGTFTSVSRGNGYQSVQSGSHAGQQSHQQAPQQAYQQPQQSYQPQAQPQQNNYQQQSQYGGNQASTTPIPILKYENEPHQGDGKYRFEYLTGNGIMAQEEGYLNNPQAQYPDYPEQVAIGSYSYTAPDGQLISVSYKADANGFQPEGAHLPTPPSLPAEYYEQVELQKKIAAEVEAEGQRILQLQAQLAQSQPQQQGGNQGQYQPQGQYQQQPQGQYQQQGHQSQQQGHQQGHQGQHSQAQHGQQSPNYNAQPSNNVYQQQQFAGYNKNAQPIGGPKPQQQYLPPQNFGKK